MWLCRKVHGMGTPDEADDAVRLCRRAVILALR
jgi:hypothetical protein